MYSQKNINQANLAILSEAENKLLNELLEDEGIPSPSERMKLIRADRLKELPLSYAQQRLWFIDQLEPGSSAYNVPTAVRLRGLLDVAALRRCLNEIVRRHEVLRTSFPQRDGQPFQHISPSSDLDLPFIDLSDEPLVQAEASALSLAQRETKRGFDLSRGPLMRTMLLKVAEADHVLVVTMHHVVSDGWSVAILVREFMQLYASFSSGQPSSLEELTLQYADFAVWQRNYLKGEVLDEQMKYWKGQLEGVSPLELPTDRPRPPVSSHAGERVRFTWGQELTAHLKALARREGATLFMVLLAGFQLLLSRYSRQSDVAIGTDVANRNLTAIESLIGFFINQLVLRCRVDPRNSFEHLLTQVREVTLDAYQHQDLPFEKLVDELSPQRDMSRAPLFQIKLVLHNTPREQLSLGSLRLESFGLESKNIKLDLNLMFEERADQLMGALNYSTDLFDPRTAHAIVEHLRVLLEAAAADPTRPVGQLPLMSEADRQQLLFVWNDTELDYGPPDCVQVLFEQQANDNPAAVAVVYEDQHLSYGELNRRANQLGHYLRGLGVGAEVRIALCLPRGLSMIVGLLGILKAGGAYVPLDLASPPQRLAAMLEDSGAAVVLTHETISDMLPMHWAQNICLDRDWPEIAAESTDDLPLTTLPQNLLYVIYTSGSTGKPKGVAVEHRQMYHYVRSIVSRLGLRPAMKMALVSSIATDLGHTVLYPALCIGGELHLISTETATDPVALGRYNQQRQIECLKITPTHMGVLVDADQAAGLMPSRLLVLGGEACRWDWVREMARAAPECRIENHYGPTECTVGVITHRVGLERPDSRPEGCVALGKPLNNVEVYVLDGWGKEVPVGVNGELYVGGSGVTRGYLNNAEATAERYVPDGLSGRKGNRLYATGDVVRWSREGELEFIGRRDNQVKIRGFRVELGEVEAVLSSCPGVAQAAVIAEAEGAQTRLVAYIVQKKGTSVDVKQWQEQLRAELPQHMVPDQMIELDQMPLLPSGKIDRKALPRHESSRQKTRAKEKRLLNSTELQLIQVWEEVLCVQCIDITGNFFELGGNSLSAVSLCARLRKIYGAQISVRMVFDAPTIESMSVLVRQNMSPSRPSSVIPINPHGEKLPFFCMPAAGGIPHSYIPLAHGLGPDQPFYALQSYGLDLGQEPLSTVEDMAAVYIEDIRRVQPAGPYQIGGWSFGVPVSFEIAQQLTAMGEKVRLLVLMDSPRNCNPADRSLSEEELRAVEQTFLAEYLQEELGLAVESLTFDQQVLLYMNTLKESGMLPADITQEQIRRYVRVTVSNKHAARLYQPKPYSGRVTLFKSSFSRHEDYSYGWKELALGGIDVFNFDASHADFVSKSNVPLVAERLRRCFETAAR